MIYIIEFFRKQRGCFAFSALLLVFLSHQGCKPKVSETGNEASEEVAPDTLPDEFAVFYDKFHTDSAYQFEHIIFPLEGLPDALEVSDTITSQRFYWQKEDWKLHSHFKDPGGQYEQWFEVINDRIIEHWVQLKGKNMFIHRRFAYLSKEENPRNSDGWVMIYYAGMRPMTK